MKLLALVKGPASISRYLARVGEAAEVPRRSAHSAVECARGAGLARPSTPGPGRANVPGYDHGGHKLGLPAREDAARLANRSCFTYALRTA